MIRTVEQYLESLRDGRVLYCLGERVKDVTMHPVLRRVVMAGAMDWVLANDPEHRPTFAGSQVRAREWRNTEKGICTTIINSEEGVSS